MKKSGILFSLICLSLLFNSCNTNKPDIYLTKSGKYASKLGGFIAEFPQKPQLTVQNNVISNIKFDTYLFQVFAGSRQIYTVSYTDYPDQILKAWPDKEQMFTQLVNGIANQGNNFFVLKKESIKSGDIQGILYELGSTVHNGYGIGKLLLKGNRLYSSNYIGIGNLPPQVSC